MNGVPVGKFKGDKIAIRCAKCRKTLMYVWLDHNRNTSPRLREARFQAHAACYNLLRDWDQAGPPDPMNGKAKSITGPSFICSRKTCGAIRRYLRSDIEQLVVDAIMYGRDSLILESPLTDWDQVERDATRSRDW